MADFEAVIGLEIHAQLQTESKIFASDPVKFGQEANTLVSAISLGHPGTLPRLNRKAVDAAIKVGLALGCQIAQDQYFDRKNYFYPDLPKGYQITQDKRPIALGGQLVLNTSAGPKTIVFDHLHLEEDAGKSLHEGDDPFSFLDYNRAGTALIEMVTEPCMHSAEEAFVLMTEMRKLLRYLEVCDGNMEEGSLRADVNVSIRPKGSQVLGTKVEIKNMNSIRNIQRAIEHEIERQTLVLNAGGQLQQETRSFDAATGKTDSMRVKETMNDYRYFPEPDLPPLQLQADWIADIKAQMPLLPWEQKERLMHSYQLPAYDAEVLSDQKDWADFFTEAAKHSTQYKAISNWLMGPIRSYTNERGISLEAMGLRPQALVEIIELIDSGQISFTLASQQLFPACLLAPEQSPKDLVLQHGWALNQDQDQLQALVKEVLNQHADKVKAYQQGKKGLLGLFVGEVMKQSKGTADPKRVNALVLEALTPIS